MANLTIPEVPQFEEEIEKLTPQTPAHANAFNAIHEKLFYNTLFLKAKNAILETDIARAIAIALGRNQALVFNTYDEMVAWFDNADNADKKAALSNGTNLYIIDKDVPDYWWSSVNQQYYQLETQKADLTKYDNLLGTNDISGLSEDGTVTGALVQQKENLDEVNTNLTATDNTKFRFETDGEGNYGYLKADDSFVPFSNNHIENAPFTFYNRYGTGTTVAEGKTGFVVNSKNLKKLTLKVTKFQYTDGATVYLCVNGVKRNIITANAIITVDIADTERIDVCSWIDKDYHYYVIGTYSLS